MKGNIQQNKTKRMRRVGLFYVLTNSFKLQFNTKNGWIHMAACAFYVMWHHITCRLWKVPLYTHERMKIRKEKFFLKPLSMIMRVILANVHCILLSIVYCLLSPSPLRLWARGRDDLLWWRSRKMHSSWWPQHSGHRDTAFQIMTF